MGVDPIAKRVTLNYMRLGDKTLQGVSIFFNPISGEGLIGAEVAAEYPFGCK